jgi:hypothetical protein
MSVTKRVILLMQFLRSYFSRENLRKQGLPILIVLTVVAIGVYLVVGSHATSPYTSTTADNGSLASGATEQSCVGASNSNCVTFGGNSGSPIVVSQGTSRTLSPDFLGYNSDATATAMTDPAFDPALAQLNPETLRGPIGGSPADFFNWQTGQYFISASTSTESYIHIGAPSPAFPLSDYVNALKAVNANGVFNINVMTYCPVSETDPVSNSSAGATCTRAQACGPSPSTYTTSCTNPDYTWGLDYQVAMLKAAQSMGENIKYIELGNELYTTTNSDYGFYFPNVQAYIAKMNVWIPVLKADFPGAEIAVVGAPSWDASWNQAISSGMEGENAIVFHTYYSSGIPTGGSIDNPQDLATLLSTATQTISSTLETKDLAPLPSGVSAWITEWNLNGENTVLEHGSWAQGLTEANYALELARLPQVELEDTHDLMSNQVWGAMFDNTSNGYVTNWVGPFATPSPVPTTQPFGLTAGGFALSALERSLRGATATSTLDLSTVPNIAGTSVPGLIGQSFTVNGKTNLYFVNLSASSENLNLGSLSGNYSALQYASSPTNFVTGDSSIPASSSTVTSGLTIPAYSVTSLVSTTAPAH